MHHGTKILEGMLFIYFFSFKRRQIKFIRTYGDHNIKEQVTNTSNINKIQYSVAFQKQPKIFGSNLIVFSFNNSNRSEVVRDSVLKITLRTYFSFRTTSFVATHASFFVSHDF